MYETMRWTNIPNRVANKPVISFRWLCDMMQSRQHVTLLDNYSNPVTGIIGQIQAEDGSGKCWNVTVGSITVFVRTV